MKRPLAGLLASAAAVPGVWFLVGADDAKTPQTSPADRDSSDIVQTRANAAERLAEVEPAFGTMSAEYLAPVAVIGSEQAPPEPKPASDTLLAQQVSLAAAEMPPIVVQKSPRLAAFVAEPVVQPLPAPALAAAPLPPKEVRPSAPAAALAVAELRPALAPRAPALPPFVAEPVIQPLPAPALAVVAPLPDEVMPPFTATTIRAAAVSQPAAAPRPAVLPQFAAQPVVQPLPVGKLVISTVVPPPQPPLAEATKAVVQHTSKPTITSVDPIRPLPAVKAKAAAAPVPVTRPLVPQNAAPLLAAAKVPVTPPKSVAVAVKVEQAKPPEPMLTAAAAIAATTQPKASSPPPRATAKPAEPASPRPRAKLLAGEVILAAYSPNPVETVTARSGPAPKAVVETTAAKTVPVGAPAPIAYPEPAFGPPEAKFIPAAYSSVEPPEQPASLGSANTLAQAVAYSYETNPRLLAERASTRSADLGYPAARAAFGPRLDASASLSYTRDRDEILPGSFLRQQGWSDTASLILSQPLLTFGRSQAQVGQAAANIDFRRESLRLVQNEVMLDVIAAYVGTLREAGAVTIARENVALLQRQLEESNARFAVREITLADVQQVETRLALGKTVLLEAQARLGEIHARFYRAVGMPPGELAPPEPLTLPVTSLPEAYALADNGSPLVRAAQARERVSRAFLSATRAESAPRVDFRGSADYGAMSDYSRELHGTRVRGTVTLSVPLFDSGARAAESGQAREANSADLQLIASAQRDSRTAVATGWNNLLAARMSIDHYRQAVESAQRAYENVQRQERAGMRSTLDVLDLARDLLNVRNAYNAALAEEYQSRASLLATLGKLDPAGMSEGLKLYDPADHFRKVRGKGDVPLLTGTLAALDGVTLPDLKANRPSPDAAALVGTAETVTGE